MKKVLIGVLLCFCFACVSSGKKIDMGAVSQIKKGTSTQQDVLNLLGSPDGITAPGNGDVIWSYGFTKVGIKPASFIPVVGMFAGGADVQMQSTTVTFSEDKIVKNISYNQHATGAGKMLSAEGDASMPEIEQNKRQ